MKTKRFALGGACAAGTTVILAYVIGRAGAAGIPTMSPVMTYSGTLTDSNGVGLSGSKNIQLQLWNMATGGTTPLCLVSSSPTLSGGSFQIALPDTCTAAVHTNPDIWTEIVVDGASLGRTKMGAVPYAVEAGNATSAGHAAAADTATTSTNATNATNATMATNATNAGHATNADNAANATNATNAGHATNADNATNATYLVEPGSHSYHETWDGATLHFWVDVTNVKNFIIAHPTDPDRYLVHTTLEGPENAVFYRGTARLQGGVAEVSLPAYFEPATKEDGRTVLLTAKFSDFDEPVSALAASDVRNGAFEVRAVDNKNPRQVFDWEVKAVRADAPALVPEPRREDIVVHGEGPYKYFTVKRP